MAEPRVQIATQFMKGFFDTVEALLAAGYRCSVEEAKGVDGGELAEAAHRAGVIIRGTIDGGGIAAVLMTPPDVLRISAAVMGEDVPDRDTLEEDDIATLGEVFEPCLGGGAGSLKELFGQELSLSNFSVGRFDAATAQSLVEEMENHAFFAPFAFDADGGVSGRGYFAAAQSLTKMLPEPAEQEEPRGGAQEAELSPDEMQDILSGFDEGGEPGKGKEAAARTEEAGGRPAPSNLDMVLDINLTCVARLGRVEMPISELLSLGPGSIIEVGQLVDEPVELLVNDKLIARGDVVVVDEKFGLRITEIISPMDRIRSLS